MNRNNFVTGSKATISRGKDIRESIMQNYDGEELLFADGFDDAIVGIQHATAGHMACIVYDYNKCIEILVERDGMSEESALEHMEYNVTGGYVGEQTPSFIDIVYA